MTNLISNGMLADMMAFYFAGNQIDCLIVMEGSDVASVVDGIAFVDDYANLEEMDGANYVRKTLGGKTAAADDAADEANFDFSDITWTALGNGTGGMIGIGLARFVTDDTDSPGCLFLEFPGGPVDPGGGDFTVRVSVDGAVVIRQAAPA